MSTFLSALAKLRSRASSGAAEFEFGRDPRRDWRLLFSVFLFLNALSVTLGAYMYLRIDKGEIFLADKRPASAFGSFSSAELERTAAFYVDKSERFEALKRSALSSADPFKEQAPPMPPKPETKKR